MHCHRCLLSCFSPNQSLRPLTGAIALQHLLWTTGHSQAASLASRHAAASSPAAGAPHHPAQQPPPQPAPTSYGAQGSSAANGSNRAQAGGATQQQPPLLLPPTSYGQQGSGAAYGGASGQCSFFGTPLQDTAGDACKPSAQIDGEVALLHTYKQGLSAGYGPGLLMAPLRASRCSAVVPTLQ
jgi:hypothetical protein